MRHIRIYCSHLENKNSHKQNKTNKQNPTKQNNHKGVLDNISSGNVNLQLKLTATIKHQHLASIIWALALEKRNSKIFICKNQRTLLLASVKSKMLIKGLSELWNTHFPIKAKTLTTTHTFLLLSSPASLNQFLNCLILWSKWLFESIRIQRSYEHQSLEWKIFPLLPFLDSSYFLKRKKALKKSPKHPYQFYAAHTGLTAHCFLQVIFYIGVQCCETQRHFSSTCISFLPDIYGTHYNVTSTHSSMLFISKSINWF